MLAARRRNDDWADTCVLLLGLEGTAGSTVSLDDEWVVVGAGETAAPVETTVNEKEKLSSDSKKPAAVQSEGVSDEGLSLVVKLLLGGAIVAACVAFIKFYASRRQAGSRGVYEKVGA